MAFAFKISPYMGSRVKFYFDETVLGKHADKHIDFDKSHLLIDLENADVIWVQYLKSNDHDDTNILVEGGVLVI